MIFPAVSFLYLLPLAGLPILFHFLLRQKSRKLVFSTLMFFDRTHPRLNSRRKLRQWLILLMRVLFIVFVLLALSRPVIRTGAGGGRVPVVIVMDNSGSMSGMFNKEQTKLQCGLEAARKIIFSLKDKTEAAVVLTVDDPAAKTTNSLTRDKKTLLKVLERIRPTHATGQADEALRQAFSLLGSGPTRRGIVQVFSDLQYDEWGKGVKRPAAGTAAGISVFLHKIESPRRDEANVAITAVRMPREKFLPRHPYNIGVVLQNTSEQQAEIRVICLGHLGGFAGNQGYNSTKKVMLSRQMSKTVSLVVKPEEPGFQGVQVRIEGDGFSADNEVGIGIICREKATVLFQGSKRAFGVLPVALSPTGRGELTGIITEFCKPDQLKKEAAGKKPILIVTTWNELSQSVVSKGANNKTEWLREYVEKGGNLLIVPARGPQQFPGKLPDWLGAGLRQRVIERQGRKLIVLDKRADFWRQIRSKTGTIPLDSVHVFAYYPLELDSGYIPLLGVDFTRVVLARKKLGGGNIYISGTVFDPQWNTLPAAPLCVVLTQRMALEAGTGIKTGTETKTKTGTGPDGKIASPSNEQLLTLMAGERAENIYRTRQSTESPYTGEVEIISLTGDSLSWKGKVENIPPFVRAGVYLIKAADRQWYVSVRASEKEGREYYIEGAKVPALSGVTHTILPYNASENYDQKNQGQFAALELFLSLLLLGTLVLLAEGLLANPARNKYGSGKEVVPSIQTASQTNPINTKDESTNVLNIGHDVTKEAADKTVITGRARV